MAAAAKNLGKERREVSRGRRGEERRGGERRGGEGREGRGGRGGRGGERRGEANLMNRS